MPGRPKVIAVSTKPGFTVVTNTPAPEQPRAQALQIGVQPRLGRAVDVVLDAPAIARDRAQHDDTAALLRFQHRRRRLQHADRARVIRLDHLARQFRLGVDLRLRRHRAEGEEDVHAAAALRRGFFARAISAAWLEKSRASKSTTDARRPLRTAISAALASRSALSRPARMTLQPSIAALCARRAIADEAPSTSQVSTRSSWPARAAAA